MSYLPICVPERLNWEAFIPRPFLATSPKSHPSPYLFFFQLKWKERKLKREYEEKIQEAKEQKEEGWR